MKQAREVAPGFDFTDDEVFAWEPHSGHGDPSGTAMAYAKQAEELGAKITLKSSKKSAGHRHGVVEQFRFRFHRSLYSTVLYSEAL